MPSLLVARYKVSIAGKICKAYLPPTWLPTSATSSRVPQVWHQLCASHQHLQSFYHLSFDIRSPLLAKSAKPTATHTSAIRRSCATSLTSIASVISASKHIYVLWPLITQYRSSTVGKICKACHYLYGHLPLLSDGRVSQVWHWLWVSSALVSTSTSYTHLSLNTRHPLLAKPAKPTSAYMTFYFCHPLVVRHRPDIDYVRHQHL